MKHALFALALLLGAVGCTNPYCGAYGEPCCADRLDGCVTPLACYRGLCGPCGGEFQGCCAGNVCGTGLFCTTGLDDNRCARPCDVFVNDCPAGTTCTWTRTDTGLCVATGPIGLDGECASLGGDCQRDLVCAAHPGSAIRFCEWPCTTATDCVPAPLRPTHECLPIADGDTRMTCF